MGRHANPDIRQAFVEFADESTPSKCAKVRCLHCGFVRAKNTTRQIEHLQQCPQYLSSSEAQTHLQSTPSGTDPSSNAGGQQSMLNGTHPNPNLVVHRRGPNQKRKSDGTPVATGGMSSTPAPPPFMPSLTRHLLDTNSIAFTSCTQQPFLSHAGYGTLSPGPLLQWLAQDSHYARGFIQFIGQLLGKIRLPIVANSQFHPMYRTMDLLITSLNNVRREMSFFEITATKYGLTVTNDPPTPITRAYLDLFISASSASASLLEGMIVLWATEHCYLTAWSYASQCLSSNALGSNNYESHIAALHQSLIPNWTSPAFSKFVEACRNLVDELANSNQSSNGKEEMTRCDAIFKQICYLQERFWPEVDGMGEEDETSGAERHGVGSGIGNGTFASPVNNGSFATPVNSATFAGPGSSDETRPFSGGLNGVEEAAAGDAS